MAWGNNGDVPWPNQNMISPGNETLRVGGLATLNGNLNVGPANNELQILSNANESRIERQGGETTLFINADVQREGGDVVISHPDNPNVSTPSVIVQSSRLRVGPGNDSGLIDANSGGDPPASRALCIGTNSQQTSHVKIGNHVAGQPQHVIQAETQMVFAGNAIILNGAQSITDANAVGLICDVPGRIDFVCNGQRRGWHDWDGFHNPPLP